MPRYKYTTNSGAIAYVKRSSAIAALDPSVEATANPADANFYVSVSNSRRRQGLTARFVTLSRVDATGPSGAKAVQRVKVACLTQAGATALSNEAAITYKGKNDWKPISLSPEG